MNTQVTNEPASTSIRKDEPRTGIGYFPDEFCTGRISLRALSKFGVGAKSNKSSHKGRSFRHRLDTTVKRIKRHVSVPLLLQG